jgi:hypothetical protein
VCGGCVARSPELGGYRGRGGCDDGGKAGRVRRGRGGWTCISRTWPLVVMVPSLRAPGVLEILRQPRSSQAGFGCRIRWRSARSG